MVEDENDTNYYFIVVVTDSEAGTQLTVGEPEPPFKARGL